MGTEDRPGEPFDTLVAEMAAMTIIDSHEHLPREEELRAEPPDLFTRLFGQYSPSTAASAGMAGARAVLKNTATPIEERWRAFKPYFAAIRDTGFARCALRAARDLFGVEEISDETYRGLSEKLQAADTPGLYDRVLRGTCRIERVVNQGTWKDDVARCLFRPSCTSTRPTRGTSPTIYRDWEAGKDRRFAGALDWARAWCGDLSADGFIGLKFGASLPVDCIDDGRADELLAKLQRGRVTDTEARALGIWLMHASIRLAPEFRFVVAIHCGMNWEVNADLASRSPMRIIPLLLRYPATVFDLYHAGIPWVREMGAIGNQYPNANLDLCWTHQISPHMSEHFLNEWMDMVPSNKIIGFGGDISAGPYKVYGALCLARENIARALAVRIRRHEMSERRAIEVCRSWLYDNPRRIYGL